MRIYLFVDLETSGLDPVMDRIVEVGWMHADGKLRRLTTTSYAVVRPVGAALDRIMTQPVVRDMHEKTGLLRELEYRTDLPLLQGVETSMLEELDQIEAAYQKFRASLSSEELLDPDISDHIEVVLAGKNVYFDKGFIDRHMPRLAARLSHRTFDETSLKYMLDALGIGINVVADEVAHGLMQHRAGYDVEMSFTTMRFVLEQFRAVQRGEPIDMEAYIVDSAKDEFTPMKFGEAVEEELRKMFGEQ
jgi:oligoribonuclease (3'-5' exoribonuclease)